MHGLTELHNSSVAFDMGYALWWRSGLTDTETLTALNTTDNHCLNQWLGLWLTDSDGGDTDSQTETIDSLEGQPNERANKKRVKTKRIYFS